MDWKQGLWNVIGSFSEEAARDEVESQATLQLATKVLESKKIELAWLLGELRTHEDQTLVAKTELATNEGLGSATPGTDSSEKGSPQRISASAESESPPKVEDLRARIDRLMSELREGELLILVAKTVQLSTRRVAALASAAGAAESETKSDLAMDAMKLRDRLLGELDAITDEVEKVRQQILSTFSIKE